LGNPDHLPLINPDGTVGVKGEKEWGLPRQRPCQRQAGGQARGGKKIAAL